MRDIYFFVLATFLSIVFAWGCAAPKKTSSPLRSRTVSTLPVSADTVRTRDTISAAITTTYTPGTAVTPGEDLSAAASSSMLTAEEKIVVQKQNGFYKQADRAATPHYDLRKPNFVIIHHTSQHSVAQTVRTFQLGHTEVSAHYIIGKDGQVVQMLNDYERAWHAGRSKWGAVTDLNSVSIGIELDNNGMDSFPEEQISSLLILLDTLKTKYRIPQLNFIGHADVAPSRKNDPNVTFPWKRLAERGFGIWYNEDYLVEPPISFNPIDALKIMGYDTSNLDAVIQAFKRKYIVKEVNKTLTLYDKAVLYDLYRKYY